MNSAKQTQLKHKLHQELKLRYREFFESKFAVALLKDLTLLPSINKISKAILNLLEKYDREIPNIIQRNPNIITELCAPYYGSCIESKDNVSAEKASKIIHAILSNNQADISQVMQIHCIFIYRIYDVLEKHPEKPALVQTIFPSSLFCKATRNRIETKKENIIPTTQLGISHNPVFAKIVGHSPKKHIRGMDKFSLDCNSQFFKSATEQSIPTVTGASGHAGSLLLGAKLYGNLDAEEFQEYVLACSAFLTAGGHHSFYEIMLIANTLNNNLRPDIYTKNIPKNILNSELYRKYQCHFPEFLDDNRVADENQPAQSTKFLIL